PGSQLRTTPMLHRPGFKAHSHVEVGDEVGLVQPSQTGASPVEARPYESIAPHLDGRRTVDEIADRPRGQTSPAEAREAPTPSERASYPADGAVTMPAGEAALWSSQGVVPQAAARRLQDARVSVKALGNLAVGPFVEALRSLQIQVDEPGRLGVVLTNDYL